MTKYKEPTEEFWAEYTKQTNKSKYSREDVLTRLVAEAYSVLGREELEEMAESMDLEVPEVIEIFEENEIEWQELKDRNK